MGCRDYLHRMMAIDSIGCLGMIMLEKSARVVVADFGVAQKEAFFYHAPRVTLREEMECVELIDIGWNRLLPSMNMSASTTLKSIDRLGRDIELYGKDKASKQLVDMLMSTPERGRRRRCEY